MWIYPHKLLEKNWQSAWRKKSSLILTSHQNEFYTDMLNINNKII